MLSAVMGSVAVVIADADIVDGLRNIDTRNGIKMPHLGRFESQIIARDLDARHKPSAFKRRRDNLSGGSPVIGHPTALASHFPANSRACQRGCQKSIKK